MQNRTESILRTINHDKSKGYSILTFPTHEAYWYNHRNSKHTYYLWQGQGIKTWDVKYRQLPPNHILLDGTDGQIKPDMRFDIVLSQNKYGQYQIARSISEYYGIPLVSIEHTLPFVGWNQKQISRMTSMRGHINVFISNYSIDQWKFDKNDPSVRVIHHAIDTDIFKPKIDGHNNSKVMTCVNDWLNRQWCIPFEPYKKICLARGIPVDPVGDTPGFSQAAKSLDELVGHYQDAGVFFNTSTISPIPSVVLESMACACPVVSTATCMIPEIIEDGYNGFISNDENILRERIDWCLSNPDKAKEIGENARKTIVEKFSVQKHVDNWDNVFNEVFGKNYEYIT